MAINDSPKKQINNPNYEKRKASNLCFEAVYGEKEAKFKKQRINDNYFYFRKYLNLGHTIGHAIEELDLGLLHGECIALGMIPFVNKDLDLVNIIHKYIDFSHLKNKNMPLVLYKLTWGKYG